MSKQDKREVEFEPHLKDKAVSEFRNRLTAIQKRIVEQKRSVILLLCGPNGSGKNSLLALIRDWMDIRSISLRAYDKRNQEQEPMEYRRYWRDLPEAGKMGIFISAWYSDPLVQHAQGKMSEKELTSALSKANRFEKLLADDGVIMAKFWIRMGSAAQKAYLTALEDDPNEKWRIMEQDWKNCSLSESFDAATDKIIQESDKERAPWHVVKGDTLTERMETLLEKLCAFLEKELDKEKKRKDKEREKTEKVEDKDKEKDKGKDKPEERKIKFLKKLDFSVGIDKDLYRERLSSLRACLNASLMELHKKGKKVILVFEGSDASGKGGAIGRLSSSLYVRDFNIIPIAAPSSGEKNHHYLWRFWKHLSEQKLLTVFDRSWYGRVLVERIEGFASEDEWRRAYDELNDFENNLSEGGNIVVKFLLYITKEEQLERFKEREKTAYKAWKITDEDWRNRDKWDAYDAAFDDMLEKTDTKTAPWFVVAGNHKKYARIEVMHQLCEYLKKKLQES